MIQLTPIFSLKLRLNALLFATASAVLTTGLSAAEQPSFTPLRSGPRAASKPSRQKQIPSSSTIRPQSMPALRSNLGQLPRSADRKRVKQPPFSPMYSAQPGFPRPSRQKQIPSSYPLKETSISPINHQQTWREIGSDFSLIFFKRKSSFLS